MKGVLHVVEVDLGMAPEDDRPYFLRLMLDNGTVRLERLLRAHAGFDEYLREQGA